MNAYMNTTTTLSPVNHEAKVVFLDIDSNARRPNGEEGEHQLQVLKALISCFIKKCQYRKIKYEFTYKMEIARQLLWLKEQLQRREAFCVVEMIRSLYVVQQQFEMLRAILGWDLSSEFVLLNELKYRFIHQGAREK